MKVLACTTSSSSVGRSFVFQASKGRTPKRPISILLQHQNNQHRHPFVRTLPVSSSPSDRDLINNFRHHGLSTRSTNNNCTKSITGKRGGIIRRANNASAFADDVGGSYDKDNANGIGRQQQQQQQHTAIGLKQLFDDESCTYSYLLWDESTRNAFLVDPVDTKVDRDLQMVDKLDLNLVYAINTHAHADHITGTGLLKQALPGLESVISKTSGAASDLVVSHGDFIFFGNRNTGNAHHLAVRETPGHTLGCISLVSSDESFVLTGDALLVRGCGRTDFQGGCPETLWESVQTQLFSLPDQTIVYPAHDYQGRTDTTIGAEKDTNPRLGSSNNKNEFVDLMNQLNLPYPKKLDVAVPANMRCGIQDDEFVER